ncbi:MAG TPA: exodeoxyribonuclease V subunit alpha [Frankiaceae bacterium]|nr:exodeoxyribonuclease V subunit alpha [Frankiaceae bacterium]
MTAPVLPPTRPPSATGPTSVDPFDVRLALRATGLLRTFNRAGVLSAADVHVAMRLGKLGREPSEQVQLAAALAVRAVRHGSVCIELGTVAASIALDEESASLAVQPLEDLPWPEPSAWQDALVGSPLVAHGVSDDLGPLDQGRPLRSVEGLLYLDRYWRQEQLIRYELDGRSARPRPGVDVEQLRTALARLWPGTPPDRQRLAAAVAAMSWGTVLAGGPGTGKTTTVARLLALLADQPGERLRIALAAPTGKAAARLQEAVRTEAARLDAADQARLGELTASTVHRLLGWRPDRRGRFRHDRTNRLPFDVVVVDETSMVSLTLMSRLLEAVRPEARLVLVGDPDQLASVEAGAVLGDLVARPVEPAGDAPSALLADLVGADLDSAEPASGVLGAGVVRLTKTHRYGGTIGELAAAVRAGDGDRVVELLRSGAKDVAFVETSDLDTRTPTGLVELRADVVGTGRIGVEAARDGDVGGALAALEQHRLLCAHRQGPFGVSRWSEEVERWLTVAIEGFGTDGEWYRGRPLLAMTNDYELKLFNGDTGMIVDSTNASGQHVPLAVFGRGGAAPLNLAPSRLSGVQTVHAMTVHRSQGSQFARVSLILPPAESPLLTRELFYTAVTRASDLVRVLGTEEAVRAAVARPILRASGLRRRFT